MKLSRRNVLRMVAVGGVTALVCVVIVFFLDTAERTRIREESEEAASLAPRRIVEPERGSTRATSPIIPMPARDVDVAEVDRPAEAQPAARRVIIEGTITDTDGTLAKDVQVSLFPTEAERPAQHAVGSTRTKEGGAYRLEVASKTLDCWVVAHKEARNPAVRRIRIPESSTKETVDLRFEPGVEITGLVLVDHQPAPGSSVDADAAWCVPGIFTDGDEMWWGPAGVSSKHSRAVCDSEGRFRLGALGRENYQLEIYPKLAGEYHRDVVTTARQTLSAPATGVVIDIPTATLGLRAVESGGGVPDVDITVKSDVSGEASKLRNAERHTPLRVPPRRAFSIEAVGAGYKKVAMKVESGPAGAFDPIDIQVERKTPVTINVTLTGAARAGITSFDAQLVVVPFRSKFFGGPERSGPSRELSVKHEGGDGFTVSNIDCAAGRYDFVVRARDSNSMLLPQHTPVDLPDSGSISVTLPAAVGGRISVSVKDPNSDAYSYEWKLRDPEGHEFVSRHASVQGNHGVLFDPGMLWPDAGRVGRAAGVYPPGPYELEVSGSGYKTVKRTVTVKPGESVTEHVTLDRAPLTSE